MWDIVSRQTGAVVATFQTGPFRYNVRDVAPKGVSDFLTDMEGRQQMNRTTFEGEDAFGGDGDDPTSSMEGYQDPSDQFVVGTIADHLRDGYAVIDQDDQGPDVQAAYTPPEGLDMHELDGWDQTSVWDAFLSLGGSHSTCSTRMAGEVRNADAWCAALKDQALGTDLWRGSAAETPVPDDLDGDVTVALTAASVDFDGSLDELAGAVRDAVDGDVTTLQSEDDYVALSPGGVDPSGDDDVDGFDPIVIVDTGDDFDVSGASDDVLDTVEGGGE